MEEKASLVSKLGRFSVVVHQNIESRHLPEHNKQTLLVIFCKYVFNRPSLPQTTTTTPLFGRSVFITPRNLTLNHIIRVWATVAMGTMA